MARVDVISIGTLDRNRLWNETTAVRTAHSTTSLIRVTAGGKAEQLVLVDPGLPAVALVARLAERTGLAPQQVRTVFLTNFTHAHRGGLEAFPHAELLMWEPEIDHARRMLEEEAERRRSAGDLEDDAIDAQLEQDLALLDRVTPAPDRLAPGVDLFPLPGHTPGTAGLLVTSPTLTTLIAGDAVPTLDHFLAGQVLPDAFDIRQAQESMSEAYEIADLVIPGHDNVFPNPRAHGM
ncbi:MAG: MBL fold metallo-hydrolase [Tepidisphaerales bacterium]